ncbi:MAG TPA: chromosomal replication initiator protein DnaA [Candidatus Saccharibacteria bacterium]|nr:chromosomal replication initiator protein DnaA [Candidatus Saccharibacteria bacterium]
MNESVWNSVLAEIEVSVSHASFVTWFRNTALQEDGDDKVTVLVPNIFAKQQLEVKFNDTIKTLLKKNGIEASQISYTIQAASSSKKKSEPEKHTDDVKPLPSVRSGNTTQLNEKYNFENFIVGSGNELAYAACQAIAVNPGTKYNPLFIYGGVGLGKTHLIQAVGNGIVANHPDSKIVYVSTETFVNEFLDSIRFKKQGFADRYRSADVLIIDDIQFIAGKEKTQEEFFHTFNALHQANKQIILTSDKPPKAIPTLEERLRSRFEWGMAIDIQPPDFETRQAILQTKASNQGVILPDDVVEFLAKNIQTNIRELEGSLNQLLAYCELRNLEPDIATAQALLKGKQHRPRHLTAKSIIEKTAQHFDIPMTEILSAKRDKSIVVPRQFAMYLLRSELHLSFPKIATELGRKDHTTAIHSVDKVEKLINDDYVTRQHLQEIREQLHA